MNRFSLSILFSALILMWPGLAQSSPSVSLSVINSYGNNVTGGTILPGTTATLTATVSGVGSGAISEVQFFNGTTLLGTATSPNTPGGNIYSYTWTVPTGNVSYSLSVQVFYNNISGSGHIIDLVGNQGSNVGTGTWVPGDNQFCATPAVSGTPTTYGWPYNGATQGEPDGSCEWTGTITTSPSMSSPSSTVDNLDNVQHTLSDFDKIANSILSKDPGTLGKTLASWYSNIGNYIGPACSGGDLPCNAVGGACSNVTCHKSGTAGSAQPGRLLSIYEPSGYPGISGYTSNYAGSTVDLFQGWYTGITNWLNDAYDTYIPGSSSVYPWCLPPTTTGSTAEDAYINSSSGTSNWGDLAHVIACLNYNSGAQIYTGATQTGSLYNLLQCQQALLTPVTCPTALPTACSSLRSLEGVPPSPYTSTGECTVNTTAYGVAGYTYADWVRDSITLAQSEASKFALRAQFLSDIYSKARSMQSVFNQGEVGLHSFLKTCNQCAVVTPCPSTGQCSDGTVCGPPSCATGTCTNGLCSGTNTPCLPAGLCSVVTTCSGNTCSDGTACGAPACADGGPAVQLINARTSGGDKAAGLPNAVIYGWVDNPSSSGQPGKAHIVKVTAYSAQRNGAGIPGTPPSPAYFQSSLPNITTWDTFFRQKYALSQRDGYVYVSVKRWDEDQSQQLQNSAVTFPNGHSLWQFMYHNPNSAVVATGTGIPGGSACLGSYAALPGKIGWGLMPSTVAGLEYKLPGGTGPQLAQQDLIALGNAFMLNDEGNGLVDPNLATAPTGQTTSCYSPYQTGPETTLNSGYCACLSQANALLATGTQSNACVEYIASGPQDPSSILSGSSSSTDQDYSLKFVNCNSINPAPPDDLVASGSG